MKYILALVLAINLTGCMWQTVNHNDIDAAIAICGGYDKIAEISARFTGDEVVHCTNRTSSFINSQAIANQTKN